MKLVSRRFEYLLLRAFFAFCRTLPRSWATALAKLLGDVLFDLIRIRRKVTLQNLVASFPGMSEAETRRIARECYRFFVGVVVSFPRISRLSAEELVRRTEFIGKEHLDAVTADGRGAILLTGHFGNWERLGAYFPAAGFATSVVVAEQRNRLVERLMDDIRRSHGLGVLSAERDLRGIMQAVGRGEFLAIVADQDAGRDGIFVDFLGRPASTAVGPVRLARRFGVPILMGVGIPTPDDGLRIEAMPPIHVPKDGDDETILRTYTAQWVRHLEDLIRRRPEMWFWMHRRWKSQPEPRTGPEEEVR